MITQFPQDGLNKKHTGAAWRHSANKCLGVSTNLLPQKVQSLTWCSPCINNLKLVGNTLCAILCIQDLISMSKNSLSTAGHIGPKSFSGNFETSFGGINTFVNRFLSMIFNDNDLRFILVPNSFMQSSNNNWHCLWKRRVYSILCNLMLDAKLRQKSPDNAIQPNKLQNVPTLENTPRYKLIIYLCA